MPRGSPRLLSKYHMDMGKRVGLGSRDSDSPQQVPKPQDRSWGQGFPDEGFWVLWGTCLGCLYSGQVSRLGFSIQREKPCVSPLMNEVLKGVVIGYLTQARD